MKIVLKAGIVAVVVLSIGFFAMKGRRDTDIISLAKSGASESEMLAAAERAPNARLTANQVIAMTQAGVSPPVIVALLRKSGNSSGVKP